MATKQALGKQPCQFYSRLGRPHEGLADQKGIHVGIAQGFDIVRGDDAALGHRNTVFANTIFQIQRGVELDFKGAQITVVYADKPGFKCQRTG